LLVLTPFQTQFNRLSHDVRVQREAYHGGAMNGHSCINMLKHAAQFSAIFKRRPFHAVGRPGTFYLGRHAPRLRILLESLYSLVRLFMAARPLCDHEKLRFRRETIEFEKNYHKFFPSHQPTPKRHHLRIHMHQWITEHHSIGAYSEQSMERVHRVYTAHARALVGVRNLDSRFETALRRVAIAISSHPRLRNVLMKKRNLRCRLCSAPRHIGRPCAA